MCKKPKVSIIVPVYKVEKFLKTCLDSILSQTFQDYELILVDDGSPDQCPHICDQYAKEHANIKVIHKTNGGLSSARLAGFEIAEGEYILFIDSDDYINERMVELLVIAIENNQAQLSMCGYYVDCEGELTPKTLPYAQTKIEGREQIVSKYILPLVGEDRLAIKLPGFLWIRLFKKELIQKDFFVSEREVFLEDHVFDLLYADNINSVAIIDEPLYYYRVNRKSLSNCYRKNKWNMYINLYAFLEKYLAERDIMDNVRLERFLVNAIFQSIDNAVLSEKYSTYIEEMQLIMNSKTVIELLKTYKNKRISIMQTIIWALFKLRMYWLIYPIRRRRIRKFYS